MFPGDPVAEGETLTKGVVTAQVVLVRSVPISCKLTP